MNTGIKPGRQKKYFLAAAALFCAAGVLFPARVSAGEAGLTSAPFLIFDPAPRGTAMGEAYTALTQDAYAAWWNPAGLAGIEMPQLAATYSASFADTVNHFASVAYPLRYGSTLGLSIIGQSVAPFQGLDAAGEVTGEILTADSAIAASYARTLYKDELEQPVLNVGATIKSVSETLDTAAGSALGVDLGLIYHRRSSRYWMKNTPARELRVGVALRNLGSGLKYDTQAFPLPQTTTLGLAWITHPAAAHTLTLVFDLTMSNYDKMKFSAGAEYFLFQLLSLRGGFVPGDGPGAGPRLGFGYRLSYLDVDYSMSPFAELGTVQKLGISLRYGTARAKQPLRGATARITGAKSTGGKAKLEALKVYANDYIEISSRNIAAREYILAYENMNKAFNLEPSLNAGAIGEKAVKLNDLIDRLHLRETPVLENTFRKNDEQANVAYEAVAAYLKGSDLKAVLLAHAALGVNTRGAALFEELLYALSDLTRTPVRRDEIMPKVALVKEKLKKAAKGFYIQKFEMAAGECEEVVLLDETNPMGWTRLGSAYYMMGGEAKSRKAYEKALELNPGDTVTRQFMDSQGWKPAKPEEPAR